MSAHFYRQHIQQGLVLSVAENFKDSCYLQRSNGQIYNLRKPSSKKKLRSKALKVLWLLFNFFY